MISSVTNNQIKMVMKLMKQAKTREEQGLYVVEGRKMFEEAREQKKELITKVYVSESYLAQYAEHQDIYFDGVDFLIVSDQVMKEMSDTITPQGIIVLLRRSVYDIKDLLKGNRIRLLVLEDIRDPGNLGTMIRTAEGAGVTGIILSKGCVDIYNPKVIRSTMGSIYRVPFYYSEHFMETLDQIRQAGIDIFAAHLEGSISYEKAEYNKKSAIMIGNEANGLSKAAAQKSTQCIRIPMEGRVESLNAAVAAAILMYEVKKRDE